MVTAFHTHSTDELLAKAELDDFGKLIKEGFLRENARILQGDVVRVDSIWAQVEFPALRANPNVTSITAVNSSTGAETLLWSK